MRTANALLLLLLVTMPLRSAAQAPSWLEDQLYAGGKMNAVAAVVGLIVLGLGIWLWAQDRRLKRLEEKLKDR